MKIICIGRNYAAHIEELKNETPDEPVVFMKPDTSLLKDGEDFYIPDFSEDVHHEIEIVLKINKNGKHIQEKFANKYYDEITLGVDFTARDVQSKLKEKGLPWLKAKGFDGAAPIGKFVTKSSLENLKQLEFRLEVNGAVKQLGDTSLMLHSFDKLVSYVSTIMTLKTGDLIFTGTPAGVAKVKIGDVLEGFIENESVLKFAVK
ncbi:MAG: fumarylacetoacetate hydrolase family protein [Bacteroidetes bacterium]|nr:fumarylacetoacetate hydrolase family protein [Bacteroidota bacterium]